MRHLAPLAVLIALTVPATAGAACAEADGTFIAIAESPCLRSPVLFCTQGTLTGDVSGAYDFVMTSQTPARDPDHPTRLTFTGASVITTPSGRMFADDTGWIEVAPGDWPFETTVNIHSGDRQHDGVTGRLVATGAFDPEAGITSGTYTGTLCTG